MGQVEAPLLVRPYLSRMSEKELLILMTAGMSTVSGSIMIALVSMLQPQFPDLNLIQHLVSASILSIPAAIMYANIMIPSAEVTNLMAMQFQRSMTVQWMQSQEGLAMVWISALMWVLFSLLLLH
jgi:CNT family concentrative nucleoside transporter